MKKEVSFYDVIIMIDDIKKIFEKEISARLSLIKVPSPLFVKSLSGLQDNLSGVEKAVSFNVNGEKFEIIHSLAKWKREALQKYEFKPYTGLYTNMKAIRKDEIIDDIHSLYVEQWDWEKVILESDRTVDYLIDTVRIIYKAIRQTAVLMRKKYPFLGISLPKNVFFITSQELENRYPDYSPKMREYLITKEKKVVFVIGVGDKLFSGRIHDHRSPDYDDWSLNGDLLIYDKEIDKEIEITSMGIRVDKKSMLEQLKKSNCEDRISLPYHQKVLKNELPFTIGGGIGETRLIMLILGKKHIAEVQTSSWPNEICQELSSYKIL